MFIHTKTIFQYAHVETNGVPLRPFVAIPTGPTAKIIYTHHETSMGLETKGWGESCASPLPPWCKDKSESKYGGRDLICSAGMHCSVRGCKVNAAGVPDCPALSYTATALYPKDCKGYGCKLLDKSTGQLTTHVVCTGDTRETCAIRSAS